MSRTIKFFLAVAIFLCVILVPPNAQAANWYVDNAASGANNGTSWANAWPSLASIDWASVIAGDTVYISGGTESKTYNERLIIGSSGTEGNIITIQVGQDEGHNGIVIIDGTNLEYSGIRMAGKSYLKISGRVGNKTGQNIRVQNFHYSGIYTSGSFSNLEIAYVDVTKNGRIAQAGSYGLRLETNAELATGLLANIHHCKFHDHFFSSEVTVAQPYSGTRSTYDQVLFHHNEIYNFHADGLTFQMEGLSVYHNKIHHRGSYMSDHPDGIQGLGGYLRIFNNEFYGFHRNDDNSVNAYIRYNPYADVENRNPDIRYVWIYNNLFFENLPLVFASASIVTHNGLTYTCKAGHYSSAEKEPGVGASWSSYWNQTGSDGNPWGAGISYTGPGNARRGIELSFGPGGLPLSSARHVYFLNNTMVGTNWFGLYLGFNSTLTTNDVSDILIANNIFVDSSMAWGGSGNGANSVLSLGRGDGSITYGGWKSSSNVVIDYNVVHASSSEWTTNSSFAGNNYSWADFITTSGTSMHPVDANVDPQLDNNYSLTEGSPCKDAGINLSSFFTTDILGTPRSGAWDIGAYEYISGAADTAPPAAPAGLTVQ